ncbi:hypothetical protein HDU84_003501 [Entophlyctis sp. JEL0112]|nr:hypothetical protein HDU84_003501 [Entophlyctis sp. JEL0112]
MSSPSAEVRHLLRGIDFSAFDAIGDSLSDLITDTPAIAHPQSVTNSSNINIPISPPIAGTNDIDPRASVQSATSNTTSMTSGSANRMHDSGNRERHESYTSTASSLAATLNSAATSTSSSSTATSLASAMSDPRWYPREPLPVPAPLIGLSSNDKTERENLSLTSSTPSTARGSKSSAIPGIDGVADRRRSPPTSPAVARASFSANSNAVRERAQQQQQQQQQQRQSVPSLEETGREPSTAGSSAGADATANPRGAEAHSVTLEAILQRMQPTPAQLLVQTNDLASLGRSVTASPQPAPTSILKSTRNSPSPSPSAAATSGGGGGGAGGVASVTRSLTRKSLSKLRSIASARPGKHHHEKGSESASLVSGTPVTAAATAASGGGATPPTLEYNMRSGSSGGTVADGGGGSGGATVTDRIKMRSRASLAALRSLVAGGGK